MIDMGLSFAVLAGRLPRVKCYPKASALMLFLVLTPYLPAALSADTWGYPDEPKVFTSENGSYRLVCLFPCIRESGQTSEQDDEAGCLEFPANTSDHCIGLMQRLDGDEWLTVWEKPLVNEVTPISGFVCDDGRYVVTLDNWFGIGEEPVVIYGPGGQLIRRHTLESLNVVSLLELDYEDVGLRDPSNIDKPLDGERADDETVNIGRMICGPLFSSSVSSVYWKDDALIWINPAQDKLIVRLWFGHYFAVRLEDGAVLGVEELGDEMDGIREHTRQEVARLLASENANDRLTGALVAGTERLREFIPRLRELCFDDHSYMRSQASSESPQTRHYTREFDVREAARIALFWMDEDVKGITVSEVIRNEAE